MIRSAVVALVLVSQTQSLPVFDVVSIRENHSNRRGSVIHGERGGRFACENVTVKALIQRAYNVHDFQISGGPKWLEDVRFDIDARRDFNSSEDATPSGQRHENERLRIQALLQDRFHLSLHPSTQILPIYSMVIAKGGPKLERASRTPNGPSPATFTASDNELSGESISMDLLAEQLTNSLGRKVVDRTELEGRYNLFLKWTPDLAVNPSKNQDPGGPSIFTAIQEQLGLKLQSEKGQVNTLIIDSVDKPSDN